MHQLMFGSEGMDDGEFISPMDIAIDSTGKTESTLQTPVNNRIQVFDSDGNHQDDVWKLG